MPGLIPFILALLLAQAAPREPVLPAQVAGIVVGLWVLLGLVLGTLLARRLGPRGLARLEGVAGPGAVAVQAVVCLATPWASSSTMQTILAVPFLAALLVFWACCTPAVNVVTGQSWSVAGLLWHRLRLGLAPALLLVVLLDLCLLTLGTLLGDAAALPWWLFLGLSLVVPLVALALAPPLITTLWGARPLPAGPRRDLILDVARRAGVRVRQVLVWPPTGGRFVNAAVLGLLPRLRYCLFSHDLLSHLDDRALAAVAGHEFGHARHGHLWLYLLYMLAAGAWAQAVLSPSLDVLDALGLGALRPQDTLPLFCLLGWWALLLRGGFGILSRACERQADLAGAELSGGPLHMQLALLQVAELSGQDPEAPNWQHHSIGQRVRFLERVRLDHRVGMWHHRAVTRIRFLVLLAMITGALALLTLGSMGQRVSLRDLTADDPTLARLVAEAHRGRPNGLQQHLAGLDPAQRQILGIAVLNSLDVSDDRSLYRNRHLLAPFAQVGTGRADLDLLLDNALAYGLVAGTRSPSPDDLALAQRLRPRLEVAAREAKDHSLLDTVACIQLVTGDRAGAEAAFTQALAWAQDDKNIDISLRERLLKLYQRRLEAARNPEAPLPLDWAEEPPATL